MTPGSGEDPSHAVLLVEDDAGIGRVVRNGLANHGIAVDWLRESSGLWEMLEARRYHALILDLMLPDGDGFALCRELREREIDVPVCMLTARDGLDDKLEGFDAGADDYLTKPFAIDELAARLRVLFRRHSPDAQTRRWEVGDLTVDGRTREVTIGGRPVMVTRREFDALAFFVAHMGEAVSRERLLDEVWKAERNVTSNAVDVYVGYLRKKLAAADSELRIEAVRGVGYKLV